jgi:asparagine synthase (glutamine-hydrolysing)
MCGIAGFADAPRSDARAPRNEADFALVHRMCEVIRHRGPDDEGIHVEPGVGLGMRRLSIIDLSTGHQPIHNEDRSVWLVFNGEIYNYRELRTELEAAGHHFYTASDTETIVHAYEEWGEGALARLRGMFGIALWDRRTRTLLVARDRAGIKPLHFVERGGRLYFGSEIKSLIAAGAVDRTIDLEALDHYLSFLYAPRDRSLFKGVRKLPPGHFLRWRDGQAAIVKYWEISAAEPFRGSEPEAAAALRRVLADAVRSHMISDVPLGAFLSGGVD